MGPWVEAGPGVGRKSLFEVGGVREGKPSKCGTEEEEALAGRWEIMRFLGQEQGQTARWSLDLGNDAFPGGRSVGRPSSGYIPVIDPSLSPHLEECRT